MNKGLQPGIMTPSIMLLPSVMTLEFPIFSSGVFIAPFEGWYLIELVGAGGSGAVGAFLAGVAMCLSGGSGAGYSWKKVYLRAGQRINFTIGAGGAAASVVGAAVAVYANGNAGGLTVCNIEGGGNIIIPGAPGGVYTGAGTPAATVGGDPGTGGDYNVGGGAGGNGLVALASAAKYVCGGGSAGYPFGTGRRGGNCTIAKNAGNYYGVTGGGSVTSNGGNETSTTTGTMYGSGTGAVSAISNYGNPRLFPTLQNVQAPDGSTTTFTAQPDGISQVVGGFITVNPFRRLFGGSADKVAGSVAGPGAGGSAALLTTGQRAGHAGTCGGSGAGYGTAAAAVIYSGYPGIGGGSGACALDGTGTANSAAGGNGFGFITFCG